MGLAAALLPFAILLVGAVIPAAPSYRFWCTAALMFAFLLVMGLAISGRPFGALINQRNLMSLSAFQSALWTIIVLAAYMTIVLTRIRKGVATPLAVGVPSELWMLLGITATSLVGAPLVLSTKVTKTPNPTSVEATAKATGESRDEIEKNRIGTLYSNPSMADARFTDMFQGDEVGNTAHVDLAKVQLFFFSLVLGFSYFAAVTASLASGELDSLPLLDKGAVALLGISHGGYLVSKAPDHSGANP